MASYKLKNKNAVGMMASSPLYTTPKPDPSDYDMTDEGDRNLYNEKLDSWHRSQQKGSEIKGSQISEKGTKFVKGAMQGQNPNVQFGGDGRRILKSGGGNVGASSGTGGGKNENVTGIPISPRIGGGGIGSGLASSFTGLGKLGTTFNPDPLVIPPPATKDKKDKKTSTNNNKKTNTQTKPTKSTGTGTQTKVKKGPASTSIKPMQGLVDLGGSDLTQNISKVRATVERARSADHDLISSRPKSGGRVGRVARRQQAKTDRVLGRLENRAQIRGIRETERGKRQAGRESAKQERKNLLMDNPVAKDAAGGRKSSKPKTGSQDFTGMKGDKPRQNQGFDYSKGGKSKRSKKKAQRGHEAQKYGI